MTMNENNKQAEPVAFNGWYCAQCQRGVAPSEVTFHETHTECGRYITDDEPPAQPVQPSRSHVNETPKNEHDSDDVLKRAPLVRLTDEDLDSVAKLKANALYRLCNKPERDDLKSAYKEVANAIMDAIEEKNK